MGHPENVVCFLFVGLLIGVVVTYVLSRYARSLTYTVVLFIVGIILAVLNAKFDLLIFGDSISMWELIDAQVLLFVFLPALLFGEAMSLNIHNVKASFSSSLLMAGPGAVFGTLALALLSKYASPIEWSWNLCFTFGAILCATDPVAIVALLKNLGASSDLTMLITLESLLNDGSALILYNYFSMSLKSSQVMSPGEVVVYAIKIIFISPLIGLAMGLGTIVAFSLANDRMRPEDVTVQVSMTICCAYLSFFIAEELVGVSGIIACCGAGMYPCMQWLRS